MDKPILQEGVNNTDSFLKEIIEKLSKGEQPKMKIIGCSCLTFDCENCSIGHL